MTDHEIKPIGDEVDKQLDRLRQSTGNEPDEEPIWTGEDQARLEEEMAKIELSPAFWPPEFKPVELKGMGITIPQTSNFAMILGIANGIRKGKEPKDMFEAAYAEEAGPRRLIEVFDRLEAEYPALYKKAEQIYQLVNVRKRRPEPNSPEAEQTLLITAKAYVAAAMIAQEIDPNYDLGFLYR